MKKLLGTKSGLLIFSLGAVVFVRFLFVKFSINPLPNSNYKSLIPHLRTGMSLAEVLKLIREKNLIFDMPRSGRGKVIVIGGESWRNFFQEERQLNLNFDESGCLCFVGEDRLYQFDEVGSVDVKLKNE